MKEPVTTETLKAEARTFAEAADLSHSGLLRLIEKWRGLQSGLSRTKSPLYSSET